MAEWSAALDSQTEALLWARGPAGRAWLRAFGQAVGRAGLGVPSEVEAALRFPLEHGDPFWWSPAMAELLAELARDVPPVTLVPELLPSQAAWHRFARPLPVPGDHPLAALAWAVVHRPGPGGPVADGVYVFGWFSTPVRAAGQPLLLVPWRFGADRPAGSVSGEPGGEVRAQLLGNLTAAMVLLLDQRILVGPRRPAERHARKRAQAAGRAEPPEVVVVELRRAATRPGGGERRAVEWSCSWVVRGHWRQQWYPSARVHRPRWIAPYVKGPADKPLRQARRVFVVRR